MTEEEQQWSHQYDWVDIEQARVQERERCARLALDILDTDNGYILAAAIRSLK